MSTSLDCPHCARPLFRMVKSGDKLRARTNILVVHRSGDVEINCVECKRGVLVPLVPAKDVVLRKAADGPKFVVPLDSTKARRA